MPVNIIESPRTITLADSDDGGSWSQSGIILSSKQDNSIFLRGANPQNQSRSLEIDSVAGDNSAVFFDYGSIIDLSPESIFSIGALFGIWVWVKDYSFLKSKDSGGLAVLTGTNIFLNDRHFIYGNDEHPKEGGWKRIWVDVNRTPEQEGVFGGTSEDSVQLFGLLLHSNGDNDSSNNIAIGPMHYLRPVSQSYIFAGGTDSDPVTFDEIYQADDSSNYGTIKNDGRYYTVDFPIKFGDDSNPMVFSDSSITIIFGDQPFAQAPSITLNCENDSSSYSFNNCVFSSEGTVFDGRFLFVGSDGSVDVTNSYLRRMTHGFFSPRISYQNCNFNDCQILYTSTNTLNGSKFENPPFGVCIDWGGFADSDLVDSAKGKIDNTTFISSNDSGHAFQFYSKMPDKMTFVNHTYSGYADSDGSTGNEVIYNSTGREILVNVIDGQFPSVRNSAGSTTIVNKLVDVSVNVKAASDLSNIEDARVLIHADSGGSLAFERPISITSAGFIATVIDSNHEFEFGDWVCIQGSTEEVYNGLVQVQGGVNQTGYQYALDSVPTTSPAPGSPHVTNVIINGLTDSNGDISTTFKFKNKNQPIIGKIRKSSSSPYYRSFPIIGSILETGFQSNVLMVLDE